jgi:prephenate dehydratase
MMPFKRDRIIIYNRLKKVKKSSDAQDCSKDKSDMKKPLRIAIQGEKGSFHDLAARKYFSSDELHILPCKTFRAVCQQVTDSSADFGIMAIENSLAGSILPNYALIQEFNFTITGEQYLNIEHHLMALPDQTLKDIKTVRSHPMALMQCSRFLEEHSYLQQIEWDDTAGSARQISEQQEKGVSAIASQLAAELSGLKILVRNIEDLKINYTRFFVFSRQKDIQKLNGNKASLSFRIGHYVGSLAAVLNIFSQNHLNLTLIQSVPIPGCPDEYRFHVDVEWQDYADFIAARNHTEKNTQELHILGIYSKSKIEL